jgi:hypothetical protein
MVYEKHEYYFNRKRQKLMYHVLNMQYICLLPKYIK